MAVIKEENYHDEQNKNNILKLRKVLDTLPPFCRDFFRGIEPYTSTRTRLAYAYDIRLFLNFSMRRTAIVKKRDYRVAFVRSGYGTTDRYRRISRIYEPVSEGRKRYHQRGTRQGEKTCRSSEFL